MLLHHRVRFLVLLVISIAPFSIVTLARGLSPTRNITSGCDSLSSGTIPFIGQSGAIRFSCNGKPAFSATGNATPSFNITATGYASLALILHSSSSCNQAKTMQSGVVVAFGSLRLGYDYCASFLDPSKAQLGSFKVSWTVGKT